MAAADKNVVGLLNGLARREYFGEAEITDEFLHQELFSDLDKEQFDAMLKRYENLMRNIVSADMDFNQLEAFLTSQTRRKQGSLTQEQAAAFLKFWKSQKVKIHDVLVQKSSWNNKLKDVSWRIDLKSQGRHLQQINTPVAIVEMQLEKRSSGSKVRYSRTYVLSASSDQCGFKLEWGCILGKLGGRPVLKGLERRRQSKRS